MIWMQQPDKRRREQAQVSICPVSPASQVLGHTWGVCRARACAVLQGKCHVAFVCEHIGEHVGMGVYVCTRGRDVYTVAHGLAGWTGLPEA